VDAIPSAGLGGAAVGHRPPGRARRAAEQQAQVAVDDVGELGGEVRADLFPCLSVERRGGETRPLATSPFQLLSKESRLGTKACSVSVTREG
jgi:hypothetical protein